MLRLHEHVSQTLQGQLEISGKRARPGGRAMMALNRCVHLRVHRGSTGSGYRKLHALLGALGGGNTTDITPAYSPGLAGCNLGL